MTTALTADAALDRICDEINARLGEAMYDYDEPRIRRLIKLNAGLEAELKKAESAEMVASLSAQLRDLSLKAAPDVAALTTATRIFSEILRQDPAVQKALLKTHAKYMREMVAMLEPARNALRQAKELVAKADAFVAAQSRDADAAGEDWATAALSFEQLANRALKEAEPWPHQLGFCKAAAEARDPALLTRCRKDLPPTKALDEVARLNRDTPFADFHARYKVDALPDALRLEIERDTRRLIPLFGKVRAQAAYVAHVRVLIDQVQIEPVDCRKGLAVLGLPSGALGKLTAAVNSPAHKRAAALAQFAKAMKLPLSGPQVATKLKSVGVA
ncbi:MAG: hypothetical protein ACKVQR_24365 [Aquabacterium sp.]